MDRLSVYLIWMRKIADYFQENPPPEYEFELRAILHDIRREIKEWSTKTDARIPDRAAPVESVGEDEHRS